MHNRETQTVFPLVGRTRSETCGLYDHLHLVPPESLHDMSAFEQ
jgi:hypothetical protein